MQQTAASKVNLNGIKFANKMAVCTLPQAGSTILIDQNRQATANLTWLMMLAATPPFPPDLQRLRHSFGGILQRNSKYYHISAEIHPNATRQYMPRNNNFKFAMYLLKGH